MVGSFLEVILNVINLPGSTWLMFTGRNSVSHRSSAPRNFDAAIVGLHSIGGALCPADGPYFHCGLAHGHHGRRPPHQSECQCDIHELPV